MLSQINDNKCLYILESNIGLKYLLTAVNESNYKNAIIKYVLFKAISKIIYENTIRNIEVVNDITINLSLIDRIDRGIFYRLKQLIYRVSRLLEIDNTIDFNNIDSRYIKLEIINIYNLAVVIEPIPERIN